MSEIRDRRQIVEIALVVLVASLMGAIGLMAWFSRMTGTDLFALKSLNVFGILLGLSGGIAGGMLLSICLSKKR